MKVSSEKSEHPPLHCKYKIYVHFPPAEEVLAYQKGTATLHDIIAARTATTGALTRQLSKMLDKEFPPKGKVQATPQLSAIKHGERYLISIWLFVHS